MRRHLLVVLEKKNKMLKTAFGATKSQVLQVGATITFCAQTAHITNICMKSGLIIFNTLAVTLRTDDAGHWKHDAGHDISPPLPYTISSQVSKKLQSLQA